MPGDLSGRLRTGVRELAASAHHVDHVLALVAADEPVRESIGMRGQPEVVEREPPHAGQAVARLGIYRGRVDALPENGAGVGGIVVGALVGAVGRRYLGDVLAQPRRRHPLDAARRRARATLDRKSTRLNSSHVSISYAVFC